MNARQILLGVAGLGCLVVGTLVQGVGTGITDAFSGSGGDYILVTGLSVLALVAAVPVLVSGRESQLDQTETPDTETPIDTPPAGQSFDETIQGWRFRTPIVGERTRTTIKNRLRTAAVEVLMRTEDCGRSQAQRLVRRGAWTDDETAAAFLGRPQQSTLNTAVAALPRRQTPAEYRAHRTADAIHAIEHGESR
ncbi:hypothetical protein [Haloferax sp. DFSO52]|uniref:DUF7269 family protein n=1 Tax=Haloferax sp. DFSO52 TaxID=3388505 RepID=UPI003A8AACB7